MENNKDQENYRNEIYSKSVRAGKELTFLMSKLLDLETII